MRIFATKEPSDNSKKTKELDVLQDKAIGSLREKVAQMKEKLERSSQTHSPAVNA